MQGRFDCRVDVSCRKLHAQRNYKIRSLGWGTELQDITVLVRTAGTASYAHALHVWYENHITAHCSRMKAAVAVDAVQHCWVTLLYLVLCRAVVLCRSRASTVYSTYGRKPKREAQGYCTMVQLHPLLPALWDTTHGSQR